MLSINKYDLYMGVTDIFEQVWDANALVGGALDVGFNRNAWLLSLHEPRLNEETRKRLNGVPFEDIPVDREPVHLRASLSIPGVDLVTREW